MFGVDVFESGFCLSDFSSVPLLFKTRWYVPWPWLTARFAYCLYDFICIYVYLFIWLMTPVMYALLGRFIYWRICNSLKSTFYYRQGFKHCYGFLLRYGHGFVPRLLLVFTLWVAFWFYVIFTNYIHLQWIGNRSSLIWVLAARHLRS